MALPRNAVWLMSQASIDAAFAELEAECTEIVRGLTVRTWNSILSRTPQFLGRMTASWTYSLNSPQFVDRSSTIPAPSPEKNGFINYENFSGLWRGHPTAMAIANAASSGRDSQFKLGDTVWFSNGVNHGEGEYAGAVESGEVKLRSVNLPGEPVRRTLDFIGVFYEHISPNKASTLKATHLGATDATSDS